MRQRLSLFVTVLALAGALTGCRPELPADSDAILYYLRNARVQGEVKRAWPEGQKYVDDVLRADAKLQRELNALLAWQNVDTLWDPADPRWQDPNAVAGQMSELTKLLGEGHTKRQELLDGLQKTIAEVPPSLNLAGDRQATFIEQVWQALGLPGPGLDADVRQSLTGLEEAPQAHQRLLKLVQESAAKPDPQAKTLAFDDPARRQQFTQAYGDVQALLQQRRAEFVRRAEVGLTAPRPSGQDDRAPRHHTYRRAYLRKQLEAAVKNLATALERARAELKQAEKQAGAPAPADAKQRASAERQVEFLKGHTVNLEQRWTALKARVDEILKKSKAAAG